MFKSAPWLMIKPIAQTHIERRGRKRSDIEQFAAIDFEMHYITLAWVKTDWKTVCKRFLFFLSEMYATSCLDQIRSISKNCCCDNKLIRYRTRRYIDFQMQHIDSDHFFSILKYANECKCMCMCALCVGLFVHSWNIKFVFSFGRSCHLQWTDYLCI